MDFAGSGIVHMKLAFIHLVRIPPHGLMFHAAIRGTMNAGVRLMAKAKRLMCELNKISAASPIRARLYPKL